jgi:hypothetical protein
MVILDFAAEDEGGNWAADYDGTGLLSSLVALRADIAAGDHRALYLAPVPPGMATLSAPLKVLADFLYVSADLIQVAATRSDRIDKGGTPTIGAVCRSSSRFRKDGPALSFCNRGGSQRTC